MLRINREDENSSTEKNTPEDEFTERCKAGVQAGSFRRNDRAGNEKSLCERTNKASEICGTRMCCVCRARKGKDGLIRIVKNKSGGFSFAEGHAEGRGAYVCKERACVEQAVKKRALNRAFRGEVPADIYGVLKGWLDGTGEGQNT